MKHILIILLALTSCLSDAQIDKKKAFFLLNSQASQEPTFETSEGHIFLTQNAIGYWNANILPKTDNDDVIESTLEDLSPSGYDFLNAGGTALPKLKVNNRLLKRNFSVQGPTGASNTNANYHRLTGAQATDLFNQDFELFVGFMCEDGDFGVNVVHILGARDIPSAVQGQIQLYISSGRLFFEYRSGGSLVQYSTTSAVFQNNSNGLQVVSIRFDATTDVFSMRVNGVAHSLTVGGNITNANTAAFNLGSRRLLLHGYDNNGTIAGINDGGSNQLISMAVTGLLTDAQRVPIYDLFSEGLEKEIVIIGDPTSYVFIEGSTAISFSVVLKNQPATDVTLTPSVSGLVTVSSAITFTSSNWHTPQTITITPPASDGTTQYYRNFDLTLTATGGLTAAQSYLCTLADDPSIVTYGRNLNFDGYAENFKILNGAYTATEQQNYLISTIFNGEGLPTGAPSSIDTYTTTQSVVCHSFNNTALTAGNKASFRRLNFTQNDSDGFTWTNRVFFWEAATPVNKLLINMEGTGGEGHAPFIDNFLGNGWDVLHAAMPTSGTSPGGGLNITNNPSVAQGSFASMVSNGVDQPDFFAYRLFLFDRIRAIDYLINTLGKNYTEIVVSGISGGNQPAIYLASVDSRVTGLITVRTFPWTAEIYTGSTQLQELQARSPLLDRVSILMGRTNAKWFNYSNLADASNNVSRTKMLHEYLIRTYPGKTDLYFENEATRATHNYGTYEIGLIEAFFN